MATKLISAYRHTCYRCKFEWESMLLAPLECPRCKSRYWDRPRPDVAPPGGPDRGAGLPAAARPDGRECGLEDYRAKGGRQ